MDNTRTYIATTRKKIVSVLFSLQVKAVVPREKYVVFASAIKTFKSTNDFDMLMTVFPTVFDNTPQHQALITSMCSSSTPQRNIFNCSCAVTLIFLILVTYKIKSEKVQCFI